MKRFGRKLLAGTIAAAMTLSMSMVSTMPVLADEKPIKIGISIWSSNDVLGSQCKTIVDQAAAALGVETQWVDQGHVSEQVTASVETLCSAGCDGIIICNSADSEMASAIATCEANQVYLTQFFRIISEQNSPDIYALAQNSQYYLGAVHEDEVTNGETLVNLLLEKGDRNIMLEGWTPGDATFLLRYEGYQKAIDAWNEANPDDQAVLSDPVYANTSADEGAKVTANFISTNYPDNMDALIVAGGGGDTLLGAIAGIEAKGLTGKIAVVSTDFLPDLDAKLESGAMAAESGGHYADPFFAFLMVYNAIKGNYATSEDGFYDMVFPYMFVDSPESYANYAAYFTGSELPYNADEIKALAELSYDDLAAACAALSVEDVVARHTK